MTKHIVMVGKSDGMYALQAKECMKWTAFTVDGGTIYQGMGDTKSEALCDLAAILNSAGHDYDTDTPLFVRVIS